MYGLNAVALVLFGCINALACRLCRCPKALREKRMTAVCLTLLVWNMVRYGILFPMVEHRVRVPVEFSSVAYFVVPAIRLLSPKRFRSWAAYSGLMAGFFYYLAAVTLGGTLYQTYPTKEIYLSLLCHGAVYLCGFVALGTEAYSAKEAPRLALGVALAVAWAALLRPVEAGREPMLIYALMDGACVKRLLPQTAWSFALVFYYLGMAGLVWLTIQGFFRKNQRQYRRFSALRAAA